MTSSSFQGRLSHIRDLLAHGRVAQATDLIESLYPADQADVLEELSADDRTQLVPRLETEKVADIFEELEDVEAAELAEHMAPEQLATILDRMEPDEAADVLGDLDEALTEETLVAMHEADGVRPLLLHPDETAGGLMTSEYLVFPQEMRAGPALSAIKEWEPKGAESSYLFLVDGDRRLIGIVSLIDVVRAAPTRPLAEIMNQEVLSVRSDDDQEAAARLMARYDLIALPVVDAEDRLVGVITVDDLVEVLEDEATEDIQRLAGSEPLERPYLSTSVLSLAWKRVGWLLLLFVTGTLTGTVMRLFEKRLANMVTLTLFVPLMIGTGGNAGSQTTATVIRAIAIGEIGWRDAGRALWHELRVSLLLGVILGLIAYGRAITWQVGRGLALVVSCSVFAIVVWAETVGCLLPLVAHWLKLDPALVSGPLMSTLVDATGLLIYFSVAALVLGG